MKQVATVNVNFGGSATSDAFDLQSRTVLSVETPDTFTSTTIKMQSASVAQDGTVGTFKNVYLVGADMSTTLFQFTVDGITGSEYDLTGCFPAGSRVIRFVASTPITKTITLSVKEV